MVKPRFKLNVGDVFTIPIDEARTGVGQVVGKWGRSNEFFAIFDVAVPPDEARERALEGLSSPILFLALSMDALLYHGDWPIVPSAPVAAGVSLPAYKVAVGSPPAMKVEDYSGERIRPATAAESESLPFRTVVAPVILEHALQAHCGLRPWDKQYDDILFEKVVSTAAMFD